MDAMGREMKKKRVARDRMRVIVYVYVCELIVECDICWNDNVVRKMDQPSFVFE